MEKMLTEAFLTGAAGQIRFCSVCVNVFVCLCKYDIHNIYIEYVVKIHQPVKVYNTQSFSFLFL